MGQAATEIFALTLRLIGAATGGVGNDRTWTFSYQKGMMTEEAIEIVADLILKLKYPSGSIKLTRGIQGVFHLLIQPGGQIVR